MNVLSARVVEFRKKKGLTQEQLAEEIHVSRGVLAGIESGIRTPSKEMAKKLAVFFQVPVEVFLFEDAHAAEKNSKIIGTGEILMIADIVTEYLHRYGYELTPEQRIALIDHFYRQNITDAEKIKESLSVMAALQFSNEKK